MNTLARMLALLMLLWTVGVKAHGMPVQLANINYLQNLNAQVPVSVKVIDEQGRAGLLSRFFDKQPTILVMGYYHCRNLCGTIMEGLLFALTKTGFTAGHQYQVIMLSIDPTDRSIDAVTQKNRYAGIFGDSAGWHFLTAPPDSAAAVARAIGFQYRYEPQSHEYIHPAGAVILTPEGRVSRYFYGVSYSPRDLRFGLIDAAAARIGSPIDYLLLLCCHYNPQTGRYDGLIMNLERILCGLTVALLGGGIYWLRRREKRDGTPLWAIIPLSIPAADTMAPRVDLLFFAVLAITGIVTLGIFIVMIWWGYKYRRANAGVDRANPPRRHRIVEYTYIFTPLAIFLCMSAAGAVLYFQEYKAPKNGEVVYVVAKQWMWKLEHATGQREINQLHVPVNTDIKLVMTSQDVIHSFYVPAFRLKHDVVPDRYVTIWFRATQPGEYRLHCAEYCGTDHAVMGGHIFVLSKTDYQRWLRQGNLNESLRARGEHLFRQYGCSGCHGNGAVVHAPNLAGLYGHPVPLADGRMMTADERFIHDHILYPNQTLPAGYPPIMPSFAGQISEEDLAALVDYIRSLQPGERIPQ